MSNRLQGKTALITGGSRGIGYAIAAAYAREGARLLLNARDGSRLEQTATKLRSDFGCEVDVFPCDVSARSDIESMVDACEAVAPIDLLVNNAGIHRAAAFVDYSAEDFRDVFDINVFGVIHVTQFVVKRMLERKAGRIVNIASTAGKWGTRNQSAYNMSKHAVVGMTRCLALEMAPSNIFVNAICPWIVATDMLDSFSAGHAALVGRPIEQLQETWAASVPLQRFIKPEEVAELAVYLGSDEASYITGQSWTVDGAYTMI
ncbi:MAG: SDR family NAD(P)-dependent oxidoreductase [Pseudomonadota bacterium]